MDTRFKMTLNGDGCNGFPSGAHYPLGASEVKHFVNSGGVIEPARTNEEILAEKLAELTQALQDYLDTTARSRNYDGILSLCSYASSSNLKFGPEGLAGVIWRDTVWAYGYQVMDDCSKGLRPIPTPSELVAGAPIMVWP